MTAKTFLKKYWIVGLMVVSIGALQLLPSSPEKSKFKLIDGQMMSYSECYDYIKKSPVVITQQFKNPSLSKEQIAAATCN